MKRALYLLACLPLLASCSSPVVTSQRTAKAFDNNLHIVSGTLSQGRFVLVENAKKGWDGQLAGGKEQWNARRNVLQRVGIGEIQHICNDSFYARKKGPIFNMLDNDETMGGLAPALGVSVAMVAYLASEAATKVENIPTSAYIEFACPSDEK